MSATEQQILKDYELNKLSEQLQTNSIAPDKPFRGTLLGTSSSSATEHATNLTKAEPNSDVEDTPARDATEHMVTVPHSDDVTE